MSVEQEHRWITAEEVSRIRGKLRARRAGDDDPEYRELLRRIDERNQYLFERYARPLVATHPGKWAAISLDGETVVRDRPGEATWAGLETFGEGNYITRKLADFPGYEFCK